MKKISQKAFGNYIKKVRTEKNISREELANRLQVSYAAVQKWECGNRYPDFEMVEDIADALGITVQDIYDNSKVEINKSIIVPVVSAVVLIALFISAGVIAMINNRNKRQVINPESSTADETESNETTAISESTSPETAENTGGELITINLYSDFAGYYGEQMGYMAKVFEDELGIKLNYVISNGEDIYSEDGRIDADIYLLAKDKYLEAGKQGWLFDMSSNGFFEEKANSYLKEGLAGYVKEELESGNLYGLEANKYYGEEGYYSITYKNCIRWDLYKELGYPQINNLEDLKKVLKDMKEICPVNENGDECYGMCYYSFSDEDPVTASPVIELLASYYGVATSDTGYYDITNDKFYYYLDEGSLYYEALDFYKSLYQEGLMPKALTYDEYLEYIKEGRVFFTLEDWGTQYSGSEEDLREGRGLLPIVMNDAVGTALYAEDASFKYWCINSNSPNIEKCMELLNYLATPDGMLTINYGPEKLCWDYDENGNTYLTDFGIKALDNRSGTVIPDEWGGGTFSDGQFLANGMMWNIKSTNADNKKDTYYYIDWKTYSDLSGSELENDWKQQTGYINKSQYYQNHSYNKIDKAIYDKYLISTDSTSEKLAKELQEKIYKYSRKTIFAETDEE